MIPKLYNGHNKTFFFVDYEGLRRAASASSSLQDIPPPAFRRGDFSAYKPKIYDPHSRVRGANGLVTSTPFPNNQIPTSQLNPGAVATLGLLPQPNFGAPGAQASNFLFIASRPFNSDQYDVRVDHQFSEKNTMFGRYSRSLQTNVDPGNFTGFIGGGTDNINNSISTILDDTHVFSPNVVNEARAGYTRISSGSRQPDSDETMLLIESALDLPINVLPAIRLCTDKHDRAGCAADVVIADRLHDVLWVFAVMRVSERAVLNDVVALFAVELRKEVVGSLITMMVVAHEDFSLRIFPKQFLHERAVVRRHTLDCFI